MTGSFVTAVLCIDGRFRRCLVDWLLTHFGTDYVDLITEPGPDSLLAENPAGSRAVGVRSRLTVSHTAHQPTAIAIAGHDDCAGNPVGPDVHWEQERRAATVLRGWYPELPILALHVDSESAVSVVTDKDDS